MTDVHTDEQRSYNMSRIRGKNTKPELILRKNLFNRGIRGYRINAGLPGKPDIAFTKYLVAVFVDGCFWHKCPMCFQEPQTRHKFWMEKISTNVKRDNRNNELLRQKNWKVIRIWEHEINQNPDKCCEKIIYTLKERGYPNGTKNS